MTCKVNRSQDWIESKASFVIGHMIYMLIIQALNRGFIWHAHLFSTQATLLRLCEDLV